MRGPALLYAVLGAAALIVGIAVPWMIHAGGGAAVPGWRGLVNPGPLSEAHQFTAGECETCHTPHQGVEARNCVTCHAATSFGDKQSTRFHAAAQECTACHVEHDGGASIVRMDHAALLTPALWQGPAATPLAPPAQRPPGGHPRLPDNVDALDCASCHSNRDPHLGYFGPQCSDCHAVTSWSIAEFRHPSVNSRECAQCHKPPPSHRMMHFEMVSQAYAGEKASVEQCFACHTTDDWNNIRDRGWYDHH